MKNHLKLLALYSCTMGLSGCSTAEQLISHINQSTATIHENRETIDSSTRVIRQNRELIEESNDAIEENYRLIKAAKDA